MDSSKTPSRFVLAFTAPQHLFAEIKALPGHHWWAPLLLISLLSLTVMVMMVARVDWPAFMENQIAQSGQTLPPGGMDQNAVDAGSKVASVIMVVVGLLIPIICYLVMALWFWLILNVCKKPVSFLQCLALYAWTDLINVPRYLITAVAAFMGSAVTLERDFKAFDPGTPLFYYSGDIGELSKLSFTLLSAVNLFAVIHLIYIAFGISAMTGMRKATALLVAFIPMLITVTIQILWAAKQH